VSLSYEYSAIGVFALSNGGSIQLKEEMPLSYELLALVFIKIKERNTTGKIRDFTFKLLAPLLIRIETDQYHLKPDPVVQSEWPGEPD
jgi:hypothetical protein